jgi:solute carrier family 35 protein F1/2
MGLGIGGCVFSLIETLALEMSGLRKISGKPYSLGYYLGYTVCLSGMYSICPYYFKHYSAVMYNLSLLTTVGYGMVVSVLFFSQAMQWLNIVAYFFVIIGLVSYSYPVQTNESVKEELLSTKPKNWQEL